MAGFTFKTYPGVGTGKDTEKELLLAILNNLGGSSTLQSDTTELTLPGTVYTANKMVVPTAGDESFSLSTENGHSLRLTGIRIYLEEAAFNASFRICFYNAAAPAQLDNNDRAETYAQSSNKIGEVTLFPGTARDGYIYIEDYTTWLDLQCADGDSNIYFNIENINGSTSTAGQKMRLQFIGLV